MILLQGAFVFLVRGLVNSKKHQLKAKAGQAEGAASCGLALKLPG